jgi:hypothetical protein
VDDDYPWAGSAQRPGGVIEGGETEDFARNIVGPLEAIRASWGTVKLRGGDSMRPRIHQLSSVLAMLSILAVTPRVHATDTDGPDCGRAIEDFGDAPEGLPIEFGIGRFPTCLAPSPAGTQEFVRPPRSSPPGATGYIRHVQSGAANYWIGCYEGPSGIDSESDGKVSDPMVGTSACDANLTVDCHSGIFEFNRKGQDDCGGGGDGGAGGHGAPCPYSELTFVGVSAFNCGPQRTVYLNVLMDLNFDGDWNDNLTCLSLPDSVAHEWVAKNRAVILPNGCSHHRVDGILTGPDDGFAWTRVSLTDEPVSDDYPWAGSALLPGGAVTGGETEDFVIFMIGPLDAKPATWGSLKTRYR